jgi:transcriptional regulator with XRE-family HTH domain
MPSGSELSECADEDFLVREGWVDFSHTSMLSSTDRLVDYLAGNGSADDVVATLAIMSHAVGELLRQWRQRRGMSQLEFASRAGVSSRHVSFVETGRTVPSRDMVLRLAEHLKVPLRERNRLLVAAGYAPVYRERTWWACPVLTDIRDQGTWGLREDVQHHGERGEEAVTASALVHGAVQG